MATRALFPDARFRSPTAVQTRSDVRDEMVYSSIRLAEAATGQAKCFTVPQGQTIPGLGTDPAPVPAYQRSYTALTTNLTKAGELGSGLGDASVRGIGITVESGAFDLALAAAATGASPGEVVQIVNQSSFALRVGGKKQIEAPTWAFPGFGGVQGSVEATGTNATPISSGFATNGQPGSGRRLKIPVMIARTDTVEGEYTYHGALSLAGSNTNTVLVWFALLTLIKGDVR